MPETTQWANLSTPLYGEAADIGALKVLAEQLDPHVVLFCTNEADRDARYSGVPAGTIVSSSATLNVWKKTATGWAELYGDTGWITAPSSWFEPNWENNDTGTRYRVKNGVVNVRIRALYRGPTVTAFNDGNIADQRVLFLPDFLRPSTNVPATYNLGNRYGGCIFFSSGGFWLHDYTGVSMESGQILEVATSYFAK